MPVNITIPVKMVVCVSELTPDLSATVRMLTIQEPTANKVSTVCSITPFIIVFFLLRGPWR